MSYFTKITDPEKIREIIIENSKDEAKYGIAKFWADREEKLLYNERTGEYYLNSFFPAFPSQAWERLLGAMTAFANNKRKLYQLDLVVTGRCHCYCWHCYRIKHCREDLEKKAIYEIYKDAYDLGVATMGITGGEPMIREDINELITKIPDGIRGQLYTTGHNIDQDFCDILLQSNIDRVIISLDFHKEEFVVKTRNNKNAFKETIQAVDVLVKNGIYTVLTICILEQFTIKDMEEYFEFVKKLGVQEIRVVMPIPQGQIEGNAIKFNYVEAKKMVKQMRAKYLEEKNAPIIVLFSEFESAFCFGCSAGACYVSVNNDGEVTPCVAVPLSFGSVYKDSLKDIYEYMGKYFKNTGKTCYGRKIGAIMDKMQVDTSKTPISQEESKKVAEKYIVQGKGAVFYEKYLRTVEEK